MWIWWLVGCVPKQARADALLQAGYLDAACALSVDPAAAVAQSRQHLDLELAIEVLPAEAFGRVPRGYGEDHHLAILAVKRGPGVSGPLQLDLRIEGWKPCTACDRAWMLERMQAPSSLEAELEVKTSSETEGTTILGAIVDPFVEMGKAMGAVAPVMMVAMLPAIAAIDSVFTLTALADPDGYRMGLTVFLWEHVVEGQPWNPSSSLPHLPSPLVIDELQRFEIAGEGTSLTEVVFRGEGVPTRASIVVDWGGRCGGSASAPYVLEGDDFVTAVASAFPSQGTRLELK